MPAGYIKLPDDSANAGPKIATQTFGAGTSTTHARLGVLVDDTGVQLEFPTTAPGSSAASVPVRQPTGVTFAVTGPLTDAQARATPIPVAVSGTPSVNVTFPGTQPVSAAALPLPAGAATEATLATLAHEGTAITGAAMPAGGASVLGWLSAVWKAITDRLPAALSAGGNLKVSVAESTASQTVSGSVSVSALPGTTWAGQTAVTLDYDTGAGVITLPMVGLALPGGGAVVAGGTTAAPFRIDPTGATTQPVSGTMTANVGSTGGIALDATLTGGTAKTINRGGAKGTTAAADITSTASGANHNAIDVALYDGAGNLLDPRSIRALTLGDVVTTAPGTNQNILAPGTNTIGAITLGNSAGKTNTLKTGVLVTTAVTADQVILTYTVTAGKTFYLTYFDITARLTTFATTATFFGTASVETPSGTKVYTTQIAGAGIASPPPGVYFTEPIPIAAGTVIRIVCTPSAVTSFTWQANFGGYEK